MKNITHHNTYWAKCVHKKGYKYSLNTACSYVCLPHIYSPKPNTHKQNYKIKNYLPNFSHNFIRISGRCGLHAPCKSKRSWFHLVIINCAAVTKNYKLLHQLCYMLNKDPVSSAIPVLGSKILNIILLLTRMSM